MTETVEATSSEVSETTEAAVNAEAKVEEASAVAEVSNVEEIKSDVIEEVEASFLDKLPEDLKKQKALQDFKDVDGLAKSYLHLNSLIGKKVSDLDPKELGEVFDKLGRPETPEKYEMPLGANEDLVKAYTTTAHKLGLNQEQARGLVEEYLVLEKEKVQEYYNGVEKQKDKWDEELKAEFGGAYDKRVEVAKKAVETFGGEELREAMNATGLGNHPAMVKAFAQIGKELLEGGLTNAEAQTSFGLTPADAQGRISVLKRDPEFMKAFMSASHPGHKDAVDEIQSYHQIIHGEGKVKAE